MIYCKLQKNSGVNQDKKRNEIEDNEKTITTNTKGHLEKPNISLEKGGSFVQNSSQAVIPIKQDGIIVNCNPFAKPGGQTLSRNMYQYTNSNNSRNPAGVINIGVSQNTRGGPFSMAIKPNSESGGTQLCSSGNNQATAHFRQNLECKEEEKEVAEIPFERISPFGEWKFNLGVSQPRRKVNTNSRSGARRYKNTLYKI
jgi:hypothetical protein